MPGILDLLLKGATGYGHGRQQFFARRQTEMDNDEAMNRYQQAMKRADDERDHQYGVEAAERQRQDDAEKAAKQEYGLSEFMNHIHAVPIGQQADFVNHWNSMYGTTWAIPGSVKTEAKTIPGRAAVAAVPDRFIPLGAPNTQGPPSLRRPGDVNVQGPPSLVYPGQIQGPPSIVRGRPGVPGIPDQHIPEVDYPAYIDPATAQHRAYIADQYRQGAIPPDQMQRVAQAHNAADGDAWQVPMRNRNFGYKPDVLSLLMNAAASSARKFRGHPMSNFVDPNGHIAQVPDLPVSADVQSRYNAEAARLRGLGVNGGLFPNGRMQNLNAVPGGIAPMPPKRRRYSQVKIGAFKQPVRVPYAPPLPGRGSNR